MQIQILETRVEKVVAQVEEVLFGQKDMKELLLKNLNLATPRIPEQLLALHPVFICPSSGGHNDKSSTHITRSNSSWREIVPEFQHPGPPLELLLSNGISPASPASCTSGDIVPLMLAMVDALELGQRIESLTSPLTNNLVGYSSPILEAGAEMTAIAFDIAGVTEIKKILPLVPLFNTFKESVVMGARNSVASSEQHMSELAMSDNPTLKFVSRKSLEPIACNKLCYVLHPDVQDNVVMKSKTRGNWKSKAQKFGNLCEVGE